jgi:hypothetical protein
MKMEPIEGSETSAYTNQTPGNYPKENLLYSEHGESLKSRILGSHYVAAFYLIHKKKSLSIIFTNINLMCKTEIALFNLINELSAHLGCTQSKKIL